MTGWWLALLALAAPDEPGTTGGEARTNEVASESAYDKEVGEEVTVYAEERVRRARDRVVERLDALGYDRVESVGDRQVFRHAEAWKGEVVLHDDGWTLVRRQPVHVEGRAMPWTKANTPVAWAGCLVYPWLCIRMSGMTTSKAKWRAVEGRTVEAMHGQVAEWNERISDLHVREKVARLPEAMDALWTEGQPLSLGLGEVDDAPRILEKSARRHALFAYWDSRTETVWGEAVRESVEAFCRAVVQSSSDPFTAEELRAWNEARSSVQPFSLERR